jgi:spore coat protein SA
MRIAFVTQPGHAVLPAAGSIELWADEVARRLSQRHEITIYASRPPSHPVPEDEDVEYCFIPHEATRTLSRGLRFAWRAFPATRPFFASIFHPLEYWLRVALAIRRSEVDVVHVFNYSQALPILRRLTRAKLVLHMHCEWLSQLDGRMIASRLRHADLIVGCSEHITNLIRERFPQHANRCITIYNGVEIENGSATPTAGGDAIRVLNVGRVSPEKGLHVLMDALERVVPEHGEIQLTVLGEESPVPHEFAVKISNDPLVRGLERFYGGSYLGRLKARMSGAVAERVTFIDRVSHDAALEYYRHADIFVYPSLFESFAIPPVEAMAAGVPVVASRVGGMQETIVHEGTGILVEREDPSALAAALVRLIEDPGLRQSLGAAGAARAAAMFAWPRIVADVEAAYRGLLGQPRAARAQPIDAVDPS